jgi:hypothetical protein
MSSEDILAFLPRSESITLSIWSSNQTIPMSLGDYYFPLTLNNKLDVYWCFTQNDMYQFGFFSVLEDPIKIDFRR